MAAHGARRLGQMLVNLERILGVELLCATQGLEFRTPLSTSPALQGVMAQLRAKVPPLQEDRYTAPDIEAASGLISRGEIARGTDVMMPELSA